MPNRRCAAISASFPSARLSNLYGLSESSGAVVLSAVDDGPDVGARAMAAGIRVPDPNLGEVGRYYVVPREPGATLDVDELTAFRRERRSDFKVPRQIIVVPELPMTPAGKIAKTVPREQATEAP